MLHLASKGFGFPSAGGNSSKKARNPNRTTTKGSDSWLINSMDEEPKPDVPNPPRQKNHWCDQNRRTCWMTHWQQNHPPLVSAKRSSTLDWNRHWQFKPTKLIPFLELMPSILQSRFPTMADSQFEWVVGVVKYFILLSSSSVDPQLWVTQLDQSIIADTWRPATQRDPCLHARSGRNATVLGSSTTVHNQTIDWYLWNDSPQQIPYTHLPTRRRIASNPLPAWWIMKVDGEPSSSFTMAGVSQTFPTTTCIPKWLNYWNYHNLKRVAGFNWQAPKSGTTMDPFRWEQHVVDTTNGNSCPWRTNGVNSSWSGNKKVEGKGMHLLRYHIRAWDIQRTRVAGEGSIAHQCFQRLRLPPIEIEAMRYLYELCTKCGSES